MSKYVCVQPNGIVSYTATISDNDLIPENNNDGSFFVGVDQEIEDAVLINSFYDKITNNFIKIPLCPDENHEFNPDTRSWVLNEDKLSASVRAKRDLLLKESDWTQLPDAKVDKAAWAEYRQALRDMPNLEGFPTTIEWATPPNKE